MPAGRKPKPPEQRAIEGDTRKVGAKLFALDQARRPNPGAGAKPPKILSAAARRVWRSLAAELERLGTLKVTDAVAFGQLCQAVADLEEAIAIIRTDGPMVEVPLVGKGGEIVGYARKAHPLSSQRNQLRRQVASLAAEFGLTASSRSRVFGEPPAKPKESLAERLRQRAAERKADRKADA